MREIIIIIHYATYILNKIGGQNLFAETRKSSQALAKKKRITHAKNREETPKKIYMHSHQFDVEEEISAKLMNIYTHFCCCYCCRIYYT